MYLAQKEEVPWPQTESPRETARLLDKFMEDRVDADDLFGENGLLKRLKKCMAERILKPSSPIISATRSMLHVAGTAATHEDGKTTKRSSNAKYFQEQFE